MSAYVHSFMRHALPMVIAELYLYDNDQVLEKATTRERQVEKLNVELEEHYGSRPKPRCRD